MSEISEPLGRFEESKASQPSDHKKTVVNSPPRPSGDMYTDFPELCKTVILSEN